MTVETSDRKQTFAGGQSTNVFSFRTLVSNPDYIQVKKVTISTGVETDLTYGVDYTVAVDSDGVGGTVTLTPSFSTSFQTVVYRVTAPLQSSDYSDWNQFPSDTVETGFDRSIMIAQEQSEETERTLRYPISASGANTELPTPESNAFIGWNSAGTGLENKDLPDPSVLQKATNLEATTGTNDVHYMTPAKVKLQVENPGSVLIPIGNYTPAPTTSTATIVAAVYPVGSIYISVVSTNPGTLLGVGTWVAFGTGRTLVGFDGGQTEFDTIEETGGEKTHLLTSGESGVPAHVHGNNTYKSGDQATTIGQGPSAFGFNRNIATDANTPADAASAHNNLQPYIVVYMWKRTA